MKSSKLTQLVFSQDSTRIYTRTKYTVQGLGLPKNAQIDSLVLYGKDNVLLEFKTSPYSDHLIQLNKDQDGSTIKYNYRIDKIYYEVKTYLQLFGLGKCRIVPFIVIDNGSDSNIQVDHIHFQQVKPHERHHSHRGVSKGMHTESMEDMQPRSSDASSSKLFTIFGSKMIAPGKTQLEILVDEKFKGSLSFTEHYSYDVRREIVYKEFKVSGFNSFEGLPLSNTLIHESTSLLGMVQIGENEPEIVEKSLVYKIEFPRGFDVRILSSTKKVQKKDEMLYTHKFEVTKTLKGSHELEFMFDTGDHELVVLIGDEKHRMKGSSVLGVTHAIAKDVGIITTEYILNEKEEKIN